MMFVNRDVETSALKYMPPGIGIIYGRRRVGKTALAQRAWPDAEYNYAPNLELSRSETVVYLIDKMLSGEDVIIDEFQAFDRLPKAIQEAYERLRHKGLWKGRLLLITSIIRYADSVLSGRSPLFGRFTLKLKLEPLAPWHAYLISDGYLLTGGIPWYLILYKEYQEKAFDLVLYDELPMILSMELRETERYIAILSRMKEFPRRPKDLRGLVENPEPYLSRLEDLGVVRKLRGINSRISYRDISDPFVRSWLFYKATKYRIKPAIERNFEACFRDKKILSKVLDLYVEEIGYHERPEIDVLAWTEEGLIAIEVKRRRLTDKEKETELVKLSKKLGSINLDAKPMIIDLSDREKIIG